MTRRDSTFGYADYADRGSAVLARYSNRKDKTMKIRTKKKTHQLQGAEISELARRLGANDEAGIAELRKMARQIEAINTTKAAMSVDKRVGFVFEEVHAGTFNAAARKAGDIRTTAITGTNGGFALDKRVDIRVTRDAKVIAEAQAKCCASAARSAVSVSKQQYADTQRLVPKDQACAARKMLLESAKGKAGSSSPRMRQIGANRHEAATRLTDRLEAAGYESKPMSYGEARALASGDTSSMNKMIVVETVSSAARNAAASGMAVAGAVAVVSSLSKLASGQMSADEAAQCVVLETVAGGARSAVTAVAAEGIRQVAKRTLPIAGAKALIGGTGPLAIAGCAVELVSDACNGELTVGKAARSVTKAAGGWAGAEGGAVVGSAIFPGIGTVIGAILGGIGGSLLGGMW
jgi:hypothetical protein